MHKIVSFDIFFHLLCVAKLIKYFSIAILLLENFKQNRTFLFRFCFLRCKIMAKCN